MIDLLLSPWLWLGGSLVCITAGFVAASGWSPPRRPRTTGQTIDFTRKRIGA